jgi:serine/threonine protein kinase
MQLFAQRDTIENMSSADVLNLQPGDVVGGYTLMSALGDGAMGSVWKARDDGNQIYAMKVLRDSLTSEDTDPDASHEKKRQEQMSARERLRREAMALQRIHHPGVCQIVDMELDDSLAFIVTELIEGLNLRDDVAANGNYVGDDLERLSCKLTEAVRAVHEAGIVHRDIKPTNVMISASGPVLVDFGIAMGEGESHVTRTGLVMGTPGFIAPEIIDGAESDADSDWWSLAAVLAYAACGRPVFGSKPMMAVLERSASGHANLSGLPPATMSAFQAALSPHKQDRPHFDALLAAIAHDAQSSTATLAGEETLTEVVRPFDINSSANDDTSRTSKLEHAQYLSNPRLAWHQGHIPALGSVDVDSEEKETKNLAIKTSLLPTTDENYPPALAVRIPAKLPVSGSQIDQESIYSPVPEASIRQKCYAKRATIVLLLLGVLLGGLAAIETPAAIIVGSFVLWILSACGLNTGGQIFRELKRGGAHKTTDTALRIAALPWQLFKSLLMTIPRTIMFAIISYVLMTAADWILGLPHVETSLSFAGFILKLPLPAGSSASLSGFVVFFCVAMSWIVVTFTGSSNQRTLETSAPSWKDWTLSLRLGAGALLGNPSTAPSDKSGLNKRKFILGAFWILTCLVLSLFIVREQSLNWAPIPLQNSIS